MNTKWLLVAMAACLLGFSSCKDEDDNNKPNCSTAWGTELQAELNAVINAGTAWSADPTPANCASYKAAYQAYINALRPYGNCSALTGQNREEFNDALEAAEDDLETLC